MVEVRGFEPLTSSVRGKRSAGLSYTPKGEGDCRADPIGCREPGTGCRITSETAPDTAGLMPSTYFLSSFRNLSCTTVVVRSDRERSTRARATSVVRRRPPVMPSG